jgi:hypothetical protein
VGICCTMKAGFEKQLAELLLLGHDLEKIAAKHAE